MASIIITGATGTAGSAALTVALSSPLVSKVTVLARRAPSITHEKLTTIILPSTEFPKGFDEFPPSLVDKLKGHTAVIWALGISQNGMKEDAYTKITYDYPMHAATALKPLGSEASPFRFIYVSGQGADQTEKSWTLFGRVKGRTEKELAAMESPSFKVVSVRPAGIEPTPERAPELGWATRIAASAASFLIPSWMITSTQLAEATVELAAGSRGWENRTDEGWINNTVLKKMADEYAGVVGQR